MCCVQTQFYVDAFRFGLVVKKRNEAVERPSVQAEGIVVTPNCGIRHSHRLHGLRRDRQRQASQHFVHYTPQQSLSRVRARSESDTLSVFDQVGHSLMSILTSLMANLTSLTLSPRRRRSRLLPRCDPSRRRRFAPLRPSPQHWYW